MAIGAIGGRQFVTITSSPADVRSAFATSVGTAAWVGAYLELLSVRNVPGLRHLGAAPGSAAGCSARSPPRRPPATPRSASVRSASATRSLPRRARNGRPARDHAGHGERGRLRLHVVSQRLLPARGRAAWHSPAAAGIIGWSAIGISLVIAAVHHRGVARQPRPDVELPVAGVDRRDERLTGSHYPHRGRPPPRWRWPDGDNAGGGANRSATRTSTEIRRRLDAADHNRFLAGQAGRGLTGSPPRRWIAGFWFSSR